MDLVLALLAFTMYLKSAECVRCYVCSPEKMPYNARKECQNFDMHEKYIEDCSSSTMCFKRIITLELSGGMTTTSVERGCASQTFSGDQRKINGKWVPVNDIYEVYDEACQEQTKVYERATKTVDCYCRGDLCNGAASYHTSLGLTVTLIILTLILFLR
ncbi:hypothetical protein ACJJTC_005975 [Scirpophaga incertulas]